MKQLPLIIFLIIIGIGCKSKVDESITPVIKKSFTISEIEGFAFQVLTITVAEKSDQAVINGKIGAANFEAKQVSSSTYALIIPSTLKEGSYNLEIKDGERSVPFKIKSAKEINNPDEYAVKYLNEMKNILDGRLKSMQDSLLKRNLTSQQTINQQRNILISNLKSAADKFNAQSEENKKKSVAFIEANRTLFDQANETLANVNFQITPNPRGKATSLCANGTASEKIKCQITNYSDGLLKIHEAFQSFSPATKFSGEPYLDAGIAILLNVVGLETMIEAKNIGEKLTSISYILTEPIELLVDGQPASDFNFKNELEKSFKIGARQRNVQEGLDSASAIALNKDFAKNFRSFINTWNLYIGNILMDKPDFAPLVYTEIATDKDATTSIEVTNVNVKPIFSVKNNILSLSFKTTQTTDQKFDFKLIYKYNGSEASLTRSGTLAKPILLGGTTWDCLIVHSSTVFWHADVIFKADGSTIYDEPEYPGAYTAYGFWKLTGNQISWSLDKEREKNFTFTGTISGDSISGTYGLDKRPWTAKKRYL